jgi:site-specific DNA-methyltransferase (adenine-specific)
VTLHHGDSRDVLRTLPDASVDSVVCDPPYALVSMTKARPDLVNASNPYARKQAERGFMGKQWDTGETAFAVEFWSEVLRVLKPGGHVIAFSGTRTYHRLAVAVEDAGFEIRDMVSWLYGSGFPKSHNQPGGWGTALKPACEPIVLARKPLIGTVAANVLAHGTGALNIDGCRVGDDGGTKGCDAGPSLGILGDGLNGSFGKPVPGLGRWPANVIHDGSDEVVGAFPETHSAGAARTAAEGSHSGAMGDVGFTHGAPAMRFGDAGGSAARFFYSAKADSLDRIGSKHPTVKPVDLMRYLCRLVTPPGGVVLDPFAGTGTTGQAAFLEGFRAILIEREAEYVADIERRMALTVAGPDEKAHAIVKAKGKVEDAGPLFAGMGQ